MTYYTYLLSLGNTTIAAALCAHLNQSLAQSTQSPAWIVGLRDASQTVDCPDFQCPPCPTGRALLQLSTVTVIYLSLNATSTTVQIRGMTTLALSALATIESLHWQSFSAWVDNSETSDAIMIVSIVGAIGGASIIAGFLIWLAWFA